MWVKIDTEENNIIMDWTAEKPVVEPEELENWYQVTSSPYITEPKLSNRGCRFENGRIYYLNTEVYFYLTQNNYVRSYSSGNHEFDYCTNLTVEELQEIVGEDNVTSGYWAIDENGLLAHMSTMDEDIAKRFNIRIRSQREKECFPYVNRGLLWYNSLSPEQLNELDTWYHAWLDAPSTLQIPDKPSWLE